MKRFFIAFLLLLIISVPNASAGWVYEKSEEVQDGITYKYKMKYVSGGFIKLHVVECNPQLCDIKVITAENGSSYLETTKSMAEKTNAVAAVNADFFNMGSVRTNSIGAICLDGEIVSTPSKNVWATFGISESGSVLMDYFGFSGRIISPQGSSTELYQINKMAPEGGAVSMFTPKWGSTVTLAKNMEAMLIKDGVVTGKVSTAGDIPFGDNNVILVTNPSVNGFFTVFNVGDSVTFEYELTGTNEKIKEATGGNSLIVKDGKMCGFTNNITGYAQRTAVGYNKKDNKIILLVCDGRQTNCKGLTQEGLATEMIELGADIAMNFDGGGSSTMVIKDNYSDSEILKNEVSSLRKVSTSVGIYNKPSVLGEVKKGNIRVSENNVLVNDYLDVEYYFTDEFNNKIAVNDSDVRIYSDDENAEIIGKRVYLKTPGLHNIYVNFKDIVSSVSVNVIGKVNSCYIYPESFQIKQGETAPFSLFVYDENGNMATVHSDAVYWTVKGVTISEGRVSSGNGFFGVDFGDNSFYCSVNGGKKPENVPGKNSFNKNQITGKSVKISAGFETYTSISAMIDVLNHERSLKKANQVIMLEKPQIENFSGVDTEKYSEIKIENTVFCVFDNKKSTFGESQLNNIIALSERKEKNIVLVMNVSPYLLANDEKTMFFDCVEKAEKSGKNIFVVYKDSSVRNYMLNGVAYVSLITNSAEFKNNSVLSFVVSGENLSYVISDN